MTELPILHKNNKASVTLKNSNLICSGDWTLSNVTHLERKLKKLRLAGPDITIDGENITLLDTAGVLLLEQIINKLELRNIITKTSGFKPGHKELLKFISKKEQQIQEVPSQLHPYSFFEVVGRETVGKYIQLKTYLYFIGLMVMRLFHSITHLSSLQLQAFLNAIDEIGYRALPIVALLSFLVGVVLAYQLGVQLQNYGANAFIVNLIGQAVLREFGALITAIVAAGRTSSSITAQLGTMKINEEIDALRTMGFSPFDILVLPKIIGALVAIPLLVVWADIFGVLGGMFMTKAIFGVSYGDFIYRFKDSINITTFMIGFSKGPAFALIVAAVGCFQGLNVSMSADSLGKQTTKSVVQSIFLIIIVDSIYSIIYSRLNI